MRLRADAPKAVRPLNADVRLHKMTPHRFANDILKPWDELDSLLVQQFAFQPDISDISRLAGYIAVAIRHQVDFSNLSDKQANHLSQAHQLISDAGDYWKHGELRKEERNSPISVAAAFEYCEDGTFRFLRNIVTLNHRALGMHDFMEASSQAAKFWMGQRVIPPFLAPARSGVKRRVSISA